MINPFYIRSIIHTLIRWLIAYFISINVAIPSTSGQSFTHKKVGFVHGEQKSQSLLHQVNHSHFQTIISQRSILQVCRNPFYIRSIIHTMKLIHSARKSGQRRNPFYIRSIIHTGLTYWMTGCGSINSRNPFYIRSIIHTRQTICVSP